MYALLLYGIPVLTIAVTLYVGFLGFRFYVAEVVRGSGDRTASGTSEGLARPTPRADGSQPRREG